MVEYPRIGVVLLSMGNRSADLAHALETLHSQQGVHLDVVLVGNGWKPEGLPDWVRTVTLSQNVGVPEGRNIGAGIAEGELIFFYDDDAALPETDILARMARVFNDPAVAVCQPRGVDPLGRPSPRRWVPRVNAAAGDKGGDVPVFWEALCMIRRSAFEEVGGWPGDFFFAHEGIDISMRLLDAGWRIRYEPSIVAYHPATPPSRHDNFYRTNSRNRVWVARRNLPAILVPAYCLVWAAATVVRVRKIAPLKVWFDGFKQGWQTDPGPRKPIRWSTVWRLTRLGRPPIF
jgi:GT2 family glycosyltransferase